MSQVSNRHSVVPFVSGETKALNDQRLIRVLYKPSKKQAQKFPSVAISVPQVPKSWVEDHLDSLKPYIVTMLETAQDGIAKSLYESSEGKIQSISDDDIGIGQIISFLEAEATGARMTKELIESWFDREVKDNLFVTIAEKLNFLEQTPEQVATIEKHVKIYRDVVSMLAGGATILGQDQIKGCRVCIQLAGESGDVGEKLTARLNAMENKKMPEMLAL